MHRNPLIIVLAALAVAGCATAPVSTQESRSIDTSHRLATPGARAADAQEGGHLVVVRDRGFSGSATNLRLSIDGVAVADLRPAGRYDVFLKEGEYVLAAIPVPNLFSANTAAEAAVTVKRGQTYVFRAGFGYGGVILQRSTLSSR